MHNLSGFFLANGHIFYCFITAQISMNAMLLGLCLAVAVVVAVAVGPVTRFVSIHLEVSFVSVKKDSFLDQMDRLVQVCVSELYAEQCYSPELELKKIAGAFHDQESFLT